MKYLISLVVILLSTGLSAQSKQDYIWLFGFGGEDSYMFDFNEEPYEFEQETLPIPMGSFNGSICDDDGNLLFFTNGCTIYNSDYELMENGDSLNYDIIIELGLANCVGGYIGSQDVLIIKSPGSDHLYYILHKTRIYNGPGEKDSIPIHYTLIDISANNGLGKVLEKNVDVYNGDACLAYYLTGINHSNQIDFWFLQPIADDSLIVTYLIDEEGIHRHLDQNSHVYFERDKSSSSGTAKFSPDGTQYAIYNETDGLLIYDFDRSTGILDFQEKVVPFDTTGIGIFCSVEWSSNSRFIYTATTTKLHQIDTWEEDGIRLIDTYNGTQDPFSTTFFLMAQAPDCKIYMCPTSGTNSYHVINSPNEMGTDCDFVQNGIQLPTSSNFGSMPNFPRFRVDEEEKCDPTIVSVFGDAVYYRRDLDVYPSPSTGLFTIELPEDFSSGRLVVTDLQAQILQDVPIDRLTFEGAVQLYDLPEGIYNIEIYPSDNKERIFYSKQVVKI